MSNKARDVGRVTQDAHKGPHPTSTPPASLHTGASRATDLLFPASAGNIYDIFHTSLSLLFMLTRQFSRTHQFAHYVLDVG